MSSKFSPFFIIFSFFEFYKDEQKKLILIPLIISLLLCWFTSFDINLVNILIAALSIFIGFLLNLMLLSFNFKNADVRPIEVGGKLWYLSDFLEEYHLTISFEILITTIIVIVLIFSSLIYKQVLIYIPFDIFYLKICSNFGILYLISLFFLVMFRVFKISYRLISYYINN